MNAIFFSDWISEHYFKRHFIYPNEVNIWIYLKKQKNKNRNYKRKNEMNKSL